MLYYAIFKANDGVLTFDIKVNANTHIDVSILVKMEI